MINGFAVALKDKDRAKISQKTRVFLAKKGNRVIPISPRTYKRGVTRATDLYRKKETPDWRLVFDKK